jgi:uncharacterized BrkB/YihY/UPF0761 family membrane protein
MNYVVQTVHCNNTKQRVMYGSFGTLLLLAMLFLIILWFPTSSSFQQED